VIDRVVSCFFSFVLVIAIVPWLLILVAVSFYYLMGIRRRTIFVSRDTMRLKTTLTSPINSLIKDAINGLPTVRCLGKRDFFMQQLFKTSDMQTRAFVTSNGGNRWTAFRIDFQAFLIGTVFAAITLFYTSPESPAQLAMMAIGF
jgi:ABC-type bacteriocin/lantibiotic exporter with double-glycine peptidase domain